MNTLASIASIGVGATVGASCRYYIGLLLLAAGLGLILAKHGFHLAQS